MKKIKKILIALIVLIWIPFANAQTKVIKSDLKVDGSLQVTGALLDTSTSAGTVDQVLTSTVTGTSWVNQDDIVSSVAKLVEIEVKNTSGITLPKGTPVYQTGVTGTGDVITISGADALISAGNQPAIGLLAQALNNNGIGTAVLSGILTNIITSPIEPGGATPTTGDKVYLKSGGGLTLVKPIGVENGIQNLGLIGKVSPASIGTIIVSSIMRTNDLPNLAEGRIWVGDGNTLVSQSIFIDEALGNVGIGTDTPTAKLEVNGDARFTGDVNIGGVTTLNGITKVFNDIINFYVYDCGTSPGCVFSDPTYIESTISASYLNGLGIASDLTVTGDVRIEGNKATIEFYDNAELISATIKFDPYANWFEFDQGIYSTQLIKSTSTIAGSSIVASTSYTFATLPNGEIGEIAHITDASTISYRAVAVGGGSSFALVVFDGTNWIYH